MAKIVSRVRPPAPPPSPPSQKCQQSQGWAPEPGILVTVVTVEAMQLRGVSTHYHTTGGGKEDKH